MLLFTILYSTMEFIYGKIFRDFSLLVRFWTWYRCPRIYLFITIVVRSVSKCWWPRWTSVVSGREKWMVFKGPSPLRTSSFSMTLKKNSETLSTSFYVISSSPIFCTSQYAYVGRNVRHWLSSSVGYLTECRNKAGCWQGSLQPNLRMWRQATVCYVITLWFKIKALFL